MCIVTVTMSFPKAKRFSDRLPDNPSPADYDVRTGFDKNSSVGKYDRFYEFSICGSGLDCCKRNGASSKSPFHSECCNPFRPSEWNKNNPRKSTHNVQQLNSIVEDSDRFSHHNNSDCNQSLLNYSFDLHEEFMYDDYDTLITQEELNDLFELSEYELGEILRRLHNEHFQVFEYKNETITSLRSPSRSSSLALPQPQVKKGYSIEDPRYKRLCSSSTVITTKSGLSSRSSMCRKIENSISSIGSSSRSSGSATEKRIEALGSSKLYELNSRSNTYITTKSSVSQISNGNVNNATRKNSNSSSSGSGTKSTDSKVSNVNNANRKISNSSRISNSHVSNTTRRISNSLSSGSGSSSSSLDKITNSSSGTSSSLKGMVKNNKISRGSSVYQQRRKSNTFTTNKSSPRYSNNGYNRNSKNWSFLKNSNVNGGSIEDIIREVIEQLRKSFRKEVCKKMDVQLQDLSNFVRSMYLGAEDKIEKQCDDAVGNILYRLNSIGVK